MKFFVEKSLLSNELKLFQGIFEKSTLMEILQNIKITAIENNVLELIATDLEISLTSSIEVKVEEPGSITVNGKKIYDLISKMPDGIVEIVENNDLQLMITNKEKTSKYKLPGLNSTDYPKLPEFDFENSITLPLDKFSSMIDKNYYIISPEMKYNLNGALLTIGKNIIEMAATDSHRLSYTYFNWELNIDEQKDLMISRKALMELLKIGNKGELHFGYDKNNLFFKYNNRILSSRILDQKFPNYKAVIPDQITSKAVVNRELLLQTIRRILVFETRDRGVRFNFYKNKLILERRTPEMGEGIDEIGIKYDGNELSVAFNGNFILDFLAHIDSEEINIDIVNSETAFVFKPLPEDEINYIYVIMPINI